MIIGRIEIGIWQQKYPRTFKDYTEISYLPGHCGCKIWTVSIFYLTLLGDECYKVESE